MKNGILLVLTAVLIGTGIWGYNQYDLNREHNIYLENQYQRMFSDMITDVENIQVNLAKSLVTGTPRQNVMLFTDLMHLSYDAQEKMSQLPIEHSNVSRTQKFLSQVGDLSMALARKNLEGKPLTPEEISTLKELHNYSNYLSEELISLQDNMSQNGLKIGEIRRKMNQKMEETNENMLATSFVNVEERMQEYPELIYDGPFSEHIKKEKPRLAGKKINKEDIEKIAKAFAGDGTTYEATVLGDVDDSRVPIYIVDLKPISGESKSPISMAVTKTGGKVMWMLDTREIGKAKLDVKQGVKIAEQFLRDKGYDNMTSTYYVKYDGQMVINFAYVQDDIIIYPDLAKVKVGLDNGKITGFEAEGYLFNHYNRKIDPPLISIEEAKEKISDAAKASEPRLAIIPTEGGKEVLCYEFKVDYETDTFLIYINANTGEEQKILQVIIQDQGVLMM
ncbi:MAG: germination protein YpeB [Bacillota bacterium]